MPVKVKFGKEVTHDLKLGLPLQLEVRDQRSEVNGHFKLSDVFENVCHDFLLVIESNKCQTWSEGRLP